MFAAINSYIHTPVITINGDNYSLEFFYVQITRCVQCSVHTVTYNYMYWQLLLLITGLKAATADHSCVWTEKTGTSYE